ncbi:sodium channel and clathrin linker 1-like [Lytechinus pictus]|uniref:sodium channel and clathrin linker 1-like n=1 Tax=Lytechinus pictus TaxID=7653 RepID=UPI0030B9D1C4
MENLYHQGDPAAPWLTSRTMLSPLITEYDRQITELSQQIGIYKIEMRDLQTKVDKLVRENSRLHQELKSVVEGQLETIQSGLRGDHSEEVAEKELVDNLRKQIELLEKERETANEMWQETVHELDRLAAEHRDMLGNSKAQVSTHHAIEAKGVALMRDNQLLRDNNYKLETANRHLQDVVTAQGQEIEGMRDQLRTAKGDLKTTAIQLKDFTSMKETLEQQCRAKDRDLGELRSRVQSYEGRIPGLQERIKELELSMELISQENMRLQGARKELEDRIKSLHQRCSDAESREYEATVQVRESIQMSENALLEKDQAMIREQQTEEEVRRLQDAMGKLVNEAGKRTRQEVDSIRKQCNSNIAKLMEEVTALETENAEKQAEIERAIREKRAVEHELEQVYKEGTAVTGDQRINELQNRIIAMERLKDETLIRAQQMEKNMHRQEYSHEEEKSRSLLVTDQLRGRLEKLSRECETLSDERLRLMEDNDDLKKKLIEFRREKEDTERSAAKDLISVEHEMSVMRREYEARLESVEESSRQSTKELRQMVLSQQKMSSKWKEECRVLGQKFEGKISELRSQLTMQKKRNEDLTNQIHQLKQQNIQSEQVVSDQMDVNRKLRQKVESAEQQATDVTRRLTDRSSRERRLAHDKKQLQAQLDKIRAELGRSDRGGHVPVHLTTSHLNDTYNHPRPNYPSVGFVRQRSSSIASSIHSYKSSHSRNSSPELSP